jgi:type IV pilus assembly protein PilQ
MRGVANSSGLNIDVDPSMDIRIVNNFSNVRVLDMLVFLAEEYELEINVIGNIVTVSKDPVESETTSACGLSRKPQPNYH